MTGPWSGLLVATAIGLLALPARASARRTAGPTVRAQGWAGARPYAERCWAMLQWRRTAARRDAQLPDLLERIASGLRAGLALGPAVAAAADGSPHPLVVELAPMVTALRHGAALAGELDRWAGAAGASPDVQLVASALDLSRQAGGATARAVDRVALTLRERRELHAEARALATQARASAGVLAVAPLLFTALVATIEPGAAAILVTTPLGGACLVAGLGLQALGAVWMARIVRSAS